MHEHKFPLLKYSLDGNMMKPQILIEKEKIYKEVDIIIWYGTMQNP